MIASAPWAGRYGHTSVIDAAGAIYVLGGMSYIGGTTEYIFFNDVWKSTDRGVNRTRRVLGGYSRGSQGVIDEYSRGAPGIPQGTRGVRGAYSRGTHGVLNGTKEYLGGTKLVPRGT